MNKINYGAVLFLLMVFTACSQDTPVASGLPGHTPVKIITLLDDEENGSRAEEEEMTYAAGEIHKGSQVDASLNILGTDSKPKVKENILFSDISNLGLTLNDFPNKNEWTTLKLTNTGDEKKDCLWGWSQLKIVDEAPVLVYNMMHTRAKMTVKLKEANGSGAEMDLSEGISVKIQALNTETLVQRSNEEDFSLVIYELGTGIQDFNLTAPVKSDGSQADIRTELTGLVSATATHQKGSNGYEPISDISLSDSECLVVTVEDTYTGLGENKVGGTYQVALSQIQINGTNLTQLKAGKHYIITLHLTHNQVVGATATIGDWTSYEASTAVGDESKVDNTTGTNP